MANSTGSLQLRRRTVATIDEVKPEPRELAAINQAAQLLASLTDLHEIGEIRNKAEAVRRYLNLSGKSLEAQNRASAIRIGAERRLGELLAGMEKQHGARGIGRKVESHDATPLSALGITKWQSSRWQLAATLPEERLQTLIQECNDAQRELTTAEVLKLARDFNRSESVKAAAAPLSDEPSDHCEAVDRLRALLQLATTWWPKESNLPAALRTFADELERDGTLDERMGN